MILFLYLLRFTIAADDTRQGTLGSASCPGSYVPITGPSSPCPMEVDGCRQALELCKSVASKYGTFDLMQDASWEEGRPAGCFKSTNGKVYFNYKYSGGNYFQNDRRICQKNKQILADHSDTAFKSWPTMDITVDKYMDSKGIFMSRGNRIGMRYDGWANEGDGMIEFSADAGKLIFGFHSLYRTVYDDRVYTFHQATFPGSGAHENMQTTKGWCNLLDKDSTKYPDDWGWSKCSCGAGQAVVGVKSQHVQDPHDKIQDRRWKITCASVQNLAISPWEDDNIKTGVTNNHGQDVDVQCPEGTVMCGLESKAAWRNDVFQRDNNSGARDRGYALKCCKAWVYDPAECASYKVTVDDFKIGKAPSSKSVTVDALSSANCGSSAPVTFTSSKERSVTREVEESMELSESLSTSFSTTQSQSSKFSWSSSRAWSTKRHASISGEVKGKAFGVEATAGFESGFESTKSGERTRGGEVASMMEQNWSSTSTRGMKQMKKTRDVTQQTFSAGYTYSMPGNSRIKLTAVSNEYRSTLEWWGTAQCFNAAGNLLETREISGKYHGALIGDTTIVVDTMDCPEDNWKLHDNSYCTKADWLKNADGSFVIMNQKRNALDTCENRADCQCVVDRGCSNEDTPTRDVPGVGAAKPGNYVLCKSGCEQRLEHSKQSCTFSYEEPSCTCKHSGGGPVSNGIKCTDGNEYACGASQTCSAHYADGSKKDFGYAFAEELNDETCQDGYHEIEAKNMPCYMTNEACQDARDRCEAAAGKMGLDFVHTFSPAEALWFPSGCFELDDGKVRFNHGIAGMHTGEKNFRLICARDFVRKPEFCVGEKCDFTKSTMCESKGCFNVDKKLEPAKVVPPAFSWTNWNTGEPNNVFAGDEDFVYQDPKKGEWVAAPHWLDLRSSLICGQRTGGKFVRFDNEKHSNARDAQKACSKRGLTLPNIRDRADNIQLLTLAKGEKVWIGLNDEAKEGTFVWATRNTKLTYSNWQSCGYHVEGLWTKFDQKFSSKIVSSTKYELAAAQEACKKHPECKAVTCNKAIKECTLRSSEILENSATEEVTYQQIACSHVEGRIYTVDRAEGKCLTREGGDPKHDFFLNIGEKSCREKCSQNPECGGYSVSTFNNCLVWLEHNLQGGGEAWGGARCNLKTSMILSRSRHKPSANQCALQVAPANVVRTPDDCDETLKGEKGKDYRGCQTKTKSGYTCQRWDAQTPFKHTRTPANYPDAGLANNYCRNPDGESTIWCYTTNPNKRWEECEPKPTKVAFEATECTQEVETKVICGGDQCDWEEYKNFAATRNVYDPPSYYKLTEAIEKCSANDQCGAVTCLADKCSLRKLDAGEKLVASDKYEVTHKVTCRANYVEMTSDKTKHTYEQAKAICEKSGLSLAVASTPAALEQFKKVGDKAKAAWMGLIAKDGEWQWNAPPAEKLTWRNWAEGQPLNNKHYEDCAHVHSNSFKWNDIPCDFVFDSYVLCAYRDGVNTVEYDLSTEKFKFNRHEAAEYCESKGMTLATILSQAENDLAFQTGKDAFAGGQMNFWIGLKQDAANKWIWDALQPRTRKDVATPQECKDICDQDLLCKFYNWEKDDGKCQLMEGTTGKLVDSKAAVSGPDDCDNLKCKGNGNKMCNSHIVASGESFWAISQKYAGVSHDQICACNGYACAAHSLAVGEVLQIPCASRRRLSITERLAPQEGELAAPLN